MAYTGSIFVKIFSQGYWIFLPGLDFYPAPFYWLACPRYYLLVVTGAGQKKIQPADKHVNDVTYFNNYITLKLNRAVTFNKYLHRILDFKTGAGFLSRPFFIRYRDFD